MLGTGIITLALPSLYQEIRLDKELEKNVLELDKQIYINYIQQFYNAGKGYSTSATSGTTALDSKSFSQDQNNHLVVMMQNSITQLSNSIEDKIPVYVKVRKTYLDLILKILGNEDQEIFLQFEDK